LFPADNCCFFAFWAHFAANLSCISPKITTRWKILTSDLPYIIEGAVTVTASQATGVAAARQTGKCETKEQNEQLDQESGKTINF